MGGIFSPKAVKGFEIFPQSLGRVGLWGISDGKEGRVKRALGKVFRGDVFGPLFEEPGLKRGAGGNTIGRGGQKGGGGNWER